MSLDYFAWDEVFEGNVFPAGIFEFEIKVIEDGASKNGKRMPKGQFKCLAPAQLKGMVYFENFVCGTDEDLDGLVPGMFGTKALKRIFKAAQVPKGTSFESLLKNCEGQRLLIQLNNYIDTSEGYEGRETNSVVGYFKIGEREVGLQNAGGSVGGGGTVKAAMPSVAVAKKASKSPTVFCGTCDKDIPAGEYAEHADNCEG